MRTIVAMLAVAFSCAGQDANLHSWVMSTSTNPAIQAIAPDVHAVRSDDCFVYVESAGLSLHSFGPLEANQYDPPLGPRRLEFRIPRHPREASRHAHTPLGIVGVFATGVPIYNAIGTASYGDQNLWHYDAVASSGTPATPLLNSISASGTRHSPIIGFALDGFPIYGPFGLDDAGRVHRMRSGYRLRGIERRDMLPEGTGLTPSQEGPAVSPEYPLGTFVEDYEYVAGTGDLDEYNGRFAKTPEYPDGTYAYFLATSDDAKPAWPYLVGSRYFGEPQLHSSARLKSQRSGRADLWTDRQQIRPGEETALTLVFHDARGRAIRFLEKVHERPVHLIVVSKDLSNFDHIHPEPAPDDSLLVTHTFTSAGEYWIYADYTAPGESPSVATFVISVAGTPQRAEPVRSNTIRIALNKPARMISGEDLHFAFQLTDTSTGQPVADLEPWLGAWAHIMIVSEDGKKFIHVHAQGPGIGPHVHTAVTGPSPSTIDATTGFNAPGVYKLWLQFMRYGELITRSWVLNIEPHGDVSRKPIQLPPGTIRVNVSAAGFEPARLNIQAGVEAHIAFTRPDAQNCANEILFPELGIRKALPPGETIIVAVPASASGEFHFACGMGMHRGLLLVRK